MEIKEWPTHIPAAVKFCLSKTWDIWNPHWEGAISFLMLSLQSPILKYPCWIPLKRDFQTGFQIQIISCGSGRFLLFFFLIWTYQRGFFLSCKLLISRCTWKGWGQLSCTPCTIYPVLVLQVFVQRAGGGREKFYIVLQMCSCLQW